MVRENIITHGTIGCLMDHFIDIVPNIHLWFYMQRQLTKMEESENECIFVPQLKQIEKL